MTENTLPEQNEFQIETTGLNPVASEAGNQVEVEVVNRIFAEGQAMAEAQYVADGSFVADEMQQQQVATEDLAQDTADSNQGDVVDDETRLVGACFAAVIAMTCVAINILSP